MNMNIFMDAASLAAIRKLASWQPDSAFYAAMNDSLDALQQTAVDYMYATFMNPGGTLEGNFAQIITPGTHGIEGRLENATAWAWRRERGFSGKTDSIGRFYPNDEGIYYMEFSLDNQKAVIRQRWNDAVKATLATL